MYSSIPIPMAFNSPEKHRGESKATIISHELDGYLIRHLHSSLRLEHIPSFSVQVKNQVVVILAPLERITLKRDTYSYASLLRCSDILGNHHPSLPNHHLRCTNNCTFHFFFFFFFVSDILEHQNHSLRNQVLKDTNNCIFSFLDILIRLAVII